MTTPKAEHLNKIIHLIDTCLANGMTPFQAMACSLEEDDWLLAYVAFKTLVREAMNA
jgi:hypothetical protein